MSKKRKPEPTAVGAFLHWWKDDKDRRLCFLEQALVAYGSSFPGRFIPLLVELLREHAEHDDDPAKRGAAGEDQ